ncbi:MAG: RNA polymerase sigma-I factor [Bacillota bacterium]
MVPSAASEAAARLAQRARDGDGAAREELLREYAPFACRVAARACGRFVVAGQDEEASIALIALNEAVDAHREERGSGFLPFAETVIKRRLIDHFRRERGRREVPLSEFDEEDADGGTINPVELKAATARPETEAEVVERRLELEAYATQLARYGLTLEDLVRVSPKHEDARLRAIAVARVLFHDAGLRGHLVARGELPLKALAEKSGVSEKTLERQRKYIIAVAVILIEGLSSLAAFLPG